MTKIFMIKENGLQQVKPVIASIWLACMGYKKIDLRFWIVKQKLYRNYLARCNFLKSTGER